MTASRRPSERRCPTVRVIADAAIGIVAREGLRALTHRAVDRDLALPAGSTSYYARTRRQLIALMVHRLAGRTRVDMPPAVRPTSPAGAAQTLAAMLDRLAERPGDHRARYALVVDLADDPELHAVLTSASPVRAGLLAAAAATLRGIGAPDPGKHAPALVALADGLLFDRVAGSGVDPASRPDAATTIEAYLRGLLLTAPGRD